MSRRLVLACLVIASVGPTARGQVPFARDLVPARAR